MNTFRSHGALLGLHAHTPLHAGSGTALGTVDLPVQRERHTHWPNIAGSALKGVLRDAYRDDLLADSGFDAMERSYEEFELDHSGTGQFRRRSDPSRPTSRRDVSDATLKLNVLFGPPTERADEFAGALSITDARLLAFPVRSLKGVFAWVSCPEALRRLAADARLAGLPDSSLPENLALSGRTFAAARDCPCIIAGKEKDVLVLEEFDYTRARDVACEPFADWIIDNVLPDRSASAAQFRSHFVLLPDDEFTHFVRHATEITARIALDYETKTVRDGALFYQEFLPAESVLYSVVLLHRARTLRCPADQTRTHFDNWTTSVNNRSYIQIGGDESTGKGLCSIRLHAGNGGTP